MTFHGVGIDFFWNCTNKTVINELEYGGRKMNNQVEIAETFNKFFSEIGPELSKEIEDVDISYMYEEFLSKTNEGFSFSFEIISQSQVLLHLSKLSKSKATGVRLYFC